VRSRAGMHHRQLLARLHGSRSPYGMQHGSEQRPMDRLLGPATMNMGVCELLFLYDRKSRWNLHLFRRPDARVFKELGAAPARAVVEEAHEGGLRMAQARATAMQCGRPT
jgi:hypothetical protein